MLSQSTFVQILQVTEQALHEIPTHEIVEKITIVRAYGQVLMLDPTNTEHERKLVRVLRDVSSIADRLNRPQLREKLKAALAAINAE